MPRKLETENDVKALVKDWFDRFRAWSYAPIQTGMGAHGIHDRIGCVPITITPEMVGYTVGLFVSVEAKRPGRRGEAREGMSAHQEDNLECINARGGVSICCDGVEDLKRLTRAVSSIGSWAEKSRLEKRLRG